METPGLRSGLVLVTQDAAGVADALVERLRASGVDARAAAEDSFAHARAIICLSALAPLPDEFAAAAVRADAINFDAFRVARAVAARFASEGGTFITVQDTDGDFGLGGSPRAAIAAASALARTAAVEWPNAVVRALDVQAAGRAPAEVASAIAGELLRGGPEPEVGLRANGERIALTVAAAPLPQTQPLRERDVAFVVATGGARGVTAACLIELARHARGHFLLFGRTAIADEPAECAEARTEADMKRALAIAAQKRGEKSDLAAIGRKAQATLAAREITATLRTLHGLGSVARYVAVDATDAPAVAVAIEAARQEWGPVTAVVHGAGVLADKLIAEKTDAQYERVMRTKVAALRALLQATDADPLRHLILFSSVAARSGNMGQCDYAMANEVLNKVAAAEKRKRGATCNVRALGWGPWDGGMVDEGLRARFASMSVSLIPLHAGAAAFVQECIARDDEATEVVLGGDARQPDLGRGGRATSAHVHVSAASHAFLDGHRIKGVPVVPVALVIEWFARLLRARAPAQPLRQIRDVKVLRGVRLPAFDDGGREVVGVVATPIDDGSNVALELKSASGGTLYTALATFEPPGDAVSLVGDDDENAQPLTQPLYGRSPLFHGESFMVLQDVKQGDQQTLYATVRGARALRWAAHDEPWCLDPAIVDGGLQMALLWAHRALGGQALPTAIEAVVVHAAGPATAPLHATLRPRSARGARGVCDVVFAKDGALVLELRGVEVHVVAQAEAPSATAAFT